ncbi:MAG: hypothetical protein BWX99_02668 [Deltaproteobacteria bacterium ADurb.Bin151]|nr:MAG: hypothetical protein BWX99_02668 [Deltaproteobacteria bacterium ADurb.Bin151]
MGHAGASECFDQRFLNDAIFHVKRQFAGTLLRRTPPDTVGKTADIFNLLHLRPPALLRDGGRAVFGALGD